MGDKIVKSKNLCCQPVVFPSLSLLSFFQFFRCTVVCQCNENLDLLHFFNQSQYSRMYCKIRPKYKAGIYIALAYKKETKKLICLAFCCI